MLKNFILLVSVASLVVAIFEDQAGKFDWRYQHIGCPKQVEYRRSEPSQSDLIYISSEASVIAAVKPTTGSIVLVSIARSGEVIRAWERENGLFVWETDLPNMERATYVASAADGSIIVLSKSSVYLLMVSNGQIKWSSSLDEARNWVGVASTQRHAVILGASTGEITAVKLNLATGTLDGKSVVAAPWYSSNSCLFIGKHLGCYDNRAFYVTSLSSENISSNEIPLPGITAILPLKTNDFIALKLQTKTYVYDLRQETPELLLTLGKTEGIAMVTSIDNKTYIASMSNEKDVKKVTITETLEKKVVFAGALKDLAGRLIKDLSLGVAGREFEIVTVGDDCKLDLFVSTYGEFVSEWSRHEALSSIAAVELIDLPLSEAQAGIESEFTIDGGNILESFVRRLLSQINQIRRAIVSASKEIFSSDALLSFHSVSFSDWFSSLRLNEIVRSERTFEAPLERDYFNLRKIIVASTHKSTVYGLDSADGSVFWSLYLGNNMAPLNSSLYSLSVPLFIQRTTAHFQYSPQGAVAFIDKLTSNGVLVTFNPVTGSFIQRIDLDAPIKRIELLPFVNADNLHPLLIIDASDRISLFPPYTSNVAPSFPTHVLSFNSKGHLEGFKLDVMRLKLVPLWKSTLALSESQKIIAVVGKPPSQRVHSSGRVLGDRSVLYKYSNPNLVAIAVADKEHSSLHIHLVDAVTGYVVFSAKRNKVTKPFYFVHCENWLTYSYWNEKAHRTEIAVIELYEGLTQTNELAFSSLTPVISPVISPVSQAYIFPQGISAMGVTDTEQGLSTRSVLIAMPFGGLYGISKRLLDPRRPLEMTPKFAEEMLIPYRPELPLVSEDFINYNQTVLNIRGIKTGPSGLESTSLVFAYGLDLFFTRMTPSGTFDILKDDFDHKLISLVLLVLVVGSFVCKKLGRSHTLKQAWQ